MQYVDPSILARVKWQGNADNTGTTSKQAYPTKSH